ncbi:MAG TPA: D-aminoacylase [Burkholderiaceae bacterium]|nr:D-aminoacylase [Burkholderiaceae bacterium]
MPDVDLLLRNADLIDGSGGPRRTADLAVAAGRIVAVGELGAVRARDVVDLQGLALAPGFVDVHTHDDRLALTDRSMAPKVSQGVTSVVVGNCGISLAPLGRHASEPPLDLVTDEAGPHFDSFAAYFAAIEAAPPAANVAALVGHTSLRVATMRSVQRRADADEIERMQARVREGLQAGALGVSTGTYYAPAAAATAAEIAAVCEPLRGTNALIASHIRDEGARVLDSMREAVGIADSIGVRQVLSHHKVIGRANFGRSRETLALLDELGARSDVCADCYPYAASSTVLRREAVAQAMRTLIAWSRTMPAAAGRYLDELAREHGVHADAMIDRLQPAGAIYFSMDEADVERILSHPRMMVGSDGLPHDAFPHPRLWGAFPRVLGHYARERGLFALETAVHKMTGLPAARFGLGDRGRLQAGFAADLVVFDPQRVRDAATFAQPICPAVGIERVYVNGALTWLQREGTGARAGGVLRRAAS